MKHELKTWPVFYDDVEVGAKCFDRSFRDELLKTPKSR